MSEALKRFAEVNPERYKELQERAKQELANPKPREVIKYTAYTDIDKLLFLQGMREFFCLSNDGHLFFESGPTNATIASLSETIKRHEWFTGQIDTIAQCDCPACKKRDEAEGNKYDYERTDELLEKYFAGR